jgi:hypothetical protein
MVLGLDADRFRVAEGGDRAADPFLVNDPVADPVGGQKVHHRSLPYQGQWLIIQSGLTLSRRLCNFQIAPAAPRGCRPHSEAR